MLRSLVVTGCLRGLHICVSVIYLLDHLVVVDVALTPDEAAHTTAAIGSCLANKTEVAKALRTVSKEQTCLVEGMVQAAHLVQFWEDRWLHPLAAIYICCDWLCLTPKVHVRYSSSDLQYRKFARIFIELCNRLCFPKLVLLLDAILMLLHCHGLQHALDVVCLMCYLFALSLDYLLITIGNISI